MSLEGVVNGVGSGDTIETQERESERSNHWRFDWSFVLDFLDVIDDEMERNNNVLMTTVN